MSFPKKTRTWDQATPADGDFFDDEFDRVYEFINSSHEEFTIDTGETIAVADVVKLVAGKIRKGNGGVEPRTTETILFAFQIQKVIRLNANQMMALYVDTSGPQEMFAVIIDVTAGTVTTGTPLLINEAEVDKQDVVRIDDTTALIAFAEDDQSDRGRVVRVTVSGTTISAGTEATFNVNTVSHVSIGKMKNSALGAIVFYADNGDSNLVKATVLTSGATPTIGSTVTLSTTGVATGSRNVSAADNYDDGVGGNNVAAVFGDDQGQFVVVNDSAAIERQIVVTNSWKVISAVHVKDDIVAVSFLNATNQAELVMIRGNNKLSPLSNILTVDSASTGIVSITLISETRLVYTIFGGGAGKVIEIDLSDSVLKLGSSTAVTANDPFTHSVSIDGILGYYLFFDAGNAKTVELDYSETIGIAKEAGTAAEVKPVAVGGFSIVHSSLVVGARHFSNAGVLTTDSTAGPLIGIALTSTFLLLLLRQRRRYGVNHGNSGSLDAISPGQELLISTEDDPLFRITDTKFGQQFFAQADGANSVVRVGSSSAHNVRIDRNSVEKIRVESAAIRLIDGVLFDGAGLSMIGSLEGTNETLHAKLITGVFGSGDTTVNIGHGIANAFTNNLVIGVDAYIVGASRMERPSLLAQIDIPTHIRMDNTNVLIVRGASGSALTAHALIIYR